MNRGLYKDGDWAQISDGNNSIPITRNKYDERGYEPPFDELPTKEEYQSD